MKKLVGSMTLEGAMVLPIVIIVLIGMLGLGFMQYELSYLQLEADRIARERSYDYGKEVDHMYWRFSRRNREEIVIPGVLGSKNVEGDIQYVRKGMRTMVCVTLQDSFTFGGILDTKLQVKGEASINDTEETIRNIQLLDDTLDSLGAYQLFKDGWRSYLEQLLKFLS